MAAVRFSACLRVTSFTCCSRRSLRLRANQGKRPIKKPLLPRGLPPLVIRASSGETLLTRIGRYRVQARFLFSRLALSHRRRTRLCNRVTPLASTLESVSIMMTSLSPAASAFDAIAPVFDSRFGSWASVAAQRRAVRAALLQQFPPGGRILEVGGGYRRRCILSCRTWVRCTPDRPIPTMVKTLHG